MAQVTLRNQDSQELIVCKLLVPQTVPNVSNMLYLLHQSLQRLRLYDDLQLFQCKDALMNPLPEDEGMFRGDLVFLAMSE